MGWNLDDYVSIINAPTADKPFNKTYTIEMLGNVVNGRPVKHLNLTMKDFKQAAINQLKAGKSVWFGCDVNQHSEAREKGLLDLDAFAEDELFDIDLSMTKAERLDYKESLMTHAMVLTGVDLVDGQPTKWKVENSWGNVRRVDGRILLPSCCGKTILDGSPTQGSSRRTNRVEAMGSDGIVGVQGLERKSPWVAYEV